MDGLKREELRREGLKEGLQRGQLQREGAGPGRRRLGALTPGSAVQAWWQRLDEPGPSQDQVVDEEHNEEHLMSEWYDFHEELESVLPL